MTDLPFVSALVQADLPVWEQCLQAEFLQKMENGTLSEDFFSVPVRQFVTGVANADMICAEYDYVEALAAHVKEKGTFPPMNNDALAQNYPGLYQSLLQIIHTTGERIKRNMDARKGER